MSLFKSYRDIKHIGKKSSAVCNIAYHIVWCPKFRKLILMGKIKEFAGTTSDIALSYPDRIHLFIEADPFDSPTNIVKIVKGITGLWMDRKFPDIESKLWRRHLPVSRA